MSKSKGRSPTSRSRTKSQSSTNSTSQPKSDLETQLARQGYRPAPSMTSQDYPSDREDTPPLGDGLGMSLETQFGSDVGTSDKFDQKRSSRRKRIVARLRISFDKLFGRS